MSIYDIDFVPLPGVDQQPAGAGLTTIDHLTHNVHRGRMDEWAGFYERLFNFREVRYFDIEGKLTGLKSKAMTRPCGKIRIPINESSDDRSQIQEYLVAYRGEGIQHVALGTADIYATVEQLRAKRRRFPGHAGHVLRAARDPAAGPQRGHRAAEAQPHPARRRAGEGRDAAADLHHATSSARSSSRSSSARATRASARATSARCSSRSSSTRSAAACSIPTPESPAFRPRAPPKAPRRCPARPDVLSAPGDFFRDLAHDGA